MHRATLVYAITLIACVAGLWTVLSLGQSLTPPQDLAGTWTLTRFHPELPSIPHADYGPNLTIDQSGKYFQFAFDSGPQLSLKLDDQTFGVIPGSPVVRLALSRPHWNLVALGEPGGDEMVITLIGPTPQLSGKWTAKCLQRTFPAGSAVKAEDKAAGVH